MSTQLFIFPTSFMRQHKKIRGRSLLWEGERLDTYRCLFNKISDTLQHWRLCTM